MEEYECRDRLLELGRVLENKELKLQDLIIGHSIKSIEKYGFGKIDSIVFDNDIVLTELYDGRIILYDNHTILEFDLYRLKCKGRRDYNYYILKSNAECDLEQAKIRYKLKKDEWDDIDENAKIELVHLKMTPYQMLNLYIEDEACNFVNQDKCWVDYLASRRGKEE